MNIHTVAENLRNTIAGKEKLLEKYLKDLCLSQLPEDAAVSFLKINIDELRRILADVEKCVEKDVYNSWRENPDRMGGQFTQDEIDVRRDW